MIFPTIPVLVSCERGDESHPGTEGCRPLGGSAPVIHSLCCPAGGRPALPAKEPNQEPTQADIRRHPATSSDGRNVTGGQGVAGSNPAVPTGNQDFSNIRTLHKSQQKSHWFVKW